MMERLQQWLRRIEATPRYTALLQFVKFGIVGASNTLISLGTYQLFLHGFGLHYQLANLLSFLVSVCNAYYWNLRYVFKNDSQMTAMQHLQAFGKALTSYGSTFLLSTILLAFWVETCGISKTLAPAINLLITIPLNFVLNKYWAFRKTPPLPNNPLENQEQENAQ